jgi:hypothetical protein
MYNHPASSVSATMAVAMTTIRLVSIVATLGFFSWVTTASQPLAINH